MNYFEGGKNECTELTLFTLRKRFRRFGGSNIDLSLPNNERNFFGKSGSCRSPSQITTAFNVPSLSSAILCVHLSLFFKVEMIMDSFYYIAVGLVPPFNIQLSSLL